MIDNNELIKKVMASNDFTPDEKVELIKAITATKEKEYIYVPYKETPNSSPYSIPSNPQYPIVTCSTETVPCSSVQYTDGHHRHGRR